MRVELEDVDRGAFAKVLDLWCGKEGLEDMVVLVSVADLLEMTGAAEQDPVLSA